MNEFGKNTTIELKLITQSMCGLCFFSLVLLFLCYVYGNTYNRLSEKEKNDIEMV